MAQSCARGRCSKSVYCLLTRCCAEKDERKGVVGIPEGVYHYSREYLFLSILVRCVASFDLFVYLFNYSSHMRIVYIYILMT